MKLPAWFPCAWCLVGIALAGYASYGLAGWLGVVLTLGVLMYAQATLGELEGRIIGRLQQPVRMHVYTSTQREDQR